MAVAWATVGSSIGVVAVGAPPEYWAGYALAREGLVVDLGITRFGLAGLLMTRSATSAAADAGLRTAETSTRTAADGTPPPTGDSDAVA